MTCGCTEIYNVTLATSSYKFQHITNCTRGDDLTGDKISKNLHMTNAEHTRHTTDVNSTCVCDYLQAR